MNYNLLNYIIETINWYNKSDINNNFLKVLRVVLKVTIFLMNAKKYIYLNILLFTISHSKT